MLHNEMALEMAIMSFGDDQRPTHEILERAKAFADFLSGKNNNPSSLAVVENLKKTAAKSSK